MIKKLLIRHLSKYPDTTVVAEPPIPGKPSMRTDFRVTGPPSVKGASSEYDVTVVSPSSQLAQAQIRQLAAPSPKPSTAAKSVLDSFLTVKAEKKNKMYAHCSATPFVPLVMSLGGTLGKDFESAMKHWKSTSPSPFPYLKSCLSLTLVRTRAEYFNFH